MTLVFHSYRRLTTEVKAVYVDADNADEVAGELTDGVIHRNRAEPRGGKPKTMRVCAEEGWVTARLPFYLAENVNGNFYPIAVEVFVKTYDRTPLNQDPYAGLHAPTFREVAGSQETAPTATAGITEEDDAGPIEESCDECGSRGPCEHGAPPVKECYGFDSEERGHTCGPGVNLKGPELDMKPGPLAGYLPRNSKGGAV